MTKRLFDIVLSLLLILAASPFLLTIAILVRATNPGPALYWSRRIGMDNREFLMPKYRTMKTGTPQLATHLLPDPDKYLTTAGGFLRKTSLDELPQLYSILKGDMSFVGPRPALFNQHDLVELRTKAGVHKLKPGLTGWAQVSGRDDLSIEDKVRYDREYLENRSFLFDSRILLLTFRKVFQKEGVHH
jgi:O-antigen biosynthesis protein WbqP